MIPSLGLTATVLQTSLAMLLEFRCPDHQERLLGVLPLYFRLGQSDDLWSEMQQHKS